MGACGLKLQRKNRVNSVLCGTGTKYKEKHRQLTSKAIDINLMNDVLFEDFIMVASTVLIAKMQGGRWHYAKTLVLLK